ncbi:(2Fe-2S)-binding protein [Streptomyces iconiensis]|uniref:(2Fe-2S)-binding protein n=1 Tax=Streptomyces iconiensis TaxID=1384038 RepID=A0ABT7A2U5_9ACTN|nr:(2Fe-2S)-binding protein [Streptomyces iconiensis]MDJ1134938.1 (2Fe-2S)-binding protein [Streptomyces iconiensis]
MSPRLVRRETDAVRRTDRPIDITVDGEPVRGIEGQSLAGVLLASGRLAWRHGPDGAPRGVFCGIGVCFDCLLTVDGERDVRACRRRARDGDEVRTQTRSPHEGEGPTTPENSPVDIPATPPAQPSRPQDGTS